MNPVLRVDDAKQAILRRLSAVTDTERVELRQALGRVLAEDVISPIDVPQHDNWRAAPTLPCSASANAY